MTSETVEEAPFNDVRDESKSPIALAKPAASDGYEVSRLIARCPPLDPNSTYCNLLQCDHFAATSVIAKLNDEVVGIISGYRQPEHPEILFIWQVAVDERARGRGLALQMLQEILRRDTKPAIRYLETTITPGNRASEALFERLAKQLNAPLNVSLKYARAVHFGGQHDDEMLHRIGPFSLL